MRRDDLAQGHDGWQVYIYIHFHPGVCVCVCNIFGIEECALISEVS